MYEHCYLVTKDVFYVKFHWESSMQVCSKTCLDAVWETRIDPEIRSELRLVFWL